MSETLRDMIKRHEGWKLTPYICPAGKRTIGAGFNYDANPMPPTIASYFRLHNAITDEMAEELLTMSLWTAEYQCEGIYPGFKEFTENRKKALIDFLYNVGAGTAMKFRRMMTAIKVGDWQQAASELKDSKWYEQVGGRGPDLVRMISEG